MYELIVGHMRGTTVCECSQTDFAARLTIGETVHQSGEEPLGLLCEVFESVVRCVRAATSFDDVVRQGEDILAFLVP